MCLSARTVSDIAAKIVGDANDLCQSMCLSARTVSDIAAKIVEGAPRNFVDCERFQSLLQSVDGNEEISSRKVVDKIPTWE